MSKKSRCRQKQIQFPALILVPTSNWMHAGKEGLPAAVIAEDHRHGVLAERSTCKWFWDSVKSMCRSQTVPLRGTKEGEEKRTDATTVRREKRGSHPHMVLVQAECTPKILLHSCIGSFETQGADFGNTHANTHRHTHTYIHSLCFLSYVTRPWRGQIKSPPPSHNTQSSAIIWGGTTKGGKTLHTLFELTHILLTFFTQSCFQNLKEAVDLYNVHQLVSHRLTWNYVLNLVFQCQKQFSLHMKKCAHELCSTATIGG